MSDDAPTSRREDKEALTKDLAGEVKREVQDKIKRIESASPGNILTPRQQCYRRLINLMKKGMAEYYSRFPERATDERSKDAEEYSIHGLKDILRVLDEYEISAKIGGTTT